MAEDLEELGGFIRELSYLYSHHNVPSEQNIGKARGIAQRVNDFVSKSKYSEANMGSLFTNLFDVKAGLLKVLKAAGTNETANDDIIAEICETFSRVFSQYGRFPERLAPYLADIKGAVFPFMISAFAAKIRQKAATLMVDILKCSSNALSYDWVEVLQLQEVYSYVFRNLVQPVKSSKVAQSDMQLIEILARSFPSVVQNDAVRLFNDFIHKMERQLLSPKPDYSVVAGCIDALAGLLVSFSDSFDESKKSKLQEYLFKIISEGIALDRRSAPRGALKLVTEQIHTFADYLVAKCSDWYKVLLLWSERPNYDDSQAGLQCFVAFLQETAKFLASHDIGHKGEIISFLVRHLYELLNKPTTSRKITGVAVEALAEMSQAFKAQDIKTLFNFVMKKIEMIVIDQAEEDVNSLHIFIQALGIVCIHLPQQITPEQTFQIEKSVVYLIGSLPILGPTIRYYCVRAVVFVLLGSYAALQSEQNYRQFLRETVFQGLIRSCLVPVGVEDKAEFTRTFIPFWTQLLQFPSRQDIAGRFSLSVISSVQQILDEVFVASISTIAHRLDFATGDPDSAEELGDGEVTSQPADAEIFANLVELCEDILGAVEPVDRLYKWIPALTEKIFQQSQRFPNNPDLYRMAGLLLGLERGRKDSVEENFLTSHIRFVTERLRRMNDECLTAALHVIFNCPAWLLVPVLDSVGPAVSSALKMGLADLSLADLTLTALERWNEEMEAEKLEAFFKDILPSLESYLRNADDIRKRAPLFRRKTTATKKYMRHVDYDPWLSLQRRAIVLLGNLPQGVIRTLAEPRVETIEREALAWRSLEQGHLNFPLPFADMKPQLALENFLPRIVHLALYSGERSAKVAASEFLHAALVYLIGNGAQSTEEYRRNHSFEKLYENLFPAVLQLAVDVDPIVRQMFTSLLLQIVHWFARPAFVQDGGSGRSAVFSTETNVLLETLFDAACTSEENSPVRTVAARAVRDFLDWNIRQSSERVLWESPTVPKVLLKKLFSLAGHKSAEKRLGASLIFNKIYRVFRESKPLLSIFTLELVGHFLGSLTLAEADHEASGTVEQCLKSLQHLHRMVLEKATIFKEASPHRRTAPFYDQGTLGELEMFLMSCIFQDEYHTRRFCMGFLEQLAGSRIAEVSEQFCKGKDVLSFLPENFEAQLDIHKWLLKQNLISKVLVQDSGFTVNFNTYVTGLQQIIECGKRESENPRTFLIFLEFLQIFLQQTPEAEEILTKIVQAKISEVILSAVMEPLVLGIHHFSNEICESFNREITGILQIVKEKGSETWKNEWRDYLKILLRNSSLNSQDRGHGFLILARTKWLGPDCPFPYSSKVLLNIALDKLCSSSAVLTRNEVRLSTEILELALELGLPLESLCTCLLDKAPGSKLSSLEIVKQRMGRDWLRILVDKMEKINSLLPNLGNGDPQQWILLTDVLQYVAENPRLKLQKGFVIVKNLLESWNVLERHAESYSQQSELQKCLELMTRIDRGQVSSSTPIRQWISRIFTKPTEIAKIRGFFKFLRLLSRTPEDEETALIRNLQQFFVNYFPVTTLHWDNEMQKADYFACFTDLSEIFANPPNLAVFTVLGDLVSREEKHPLLEKFQENLQKFTRNSDSAVQVKALRKSYDICKNSRFYLQNFRQIFNYLLTNVTYEALETAVLEQMGNLIDSIGSSTVSNSSSYAEKITNCEIIAILFSRMDAETLHGKINEEFCRIRKEQKQADGKNFVKFALGAVFKLQRLGNVPSDSDLKNFYWKLQCASYNASVSIVVNGQNSEELIGKLLFERLNTTAWENLIGTAQYYSLNIQLEKIPEQKKVLVHLRGKTRNTELEGGLGSVAFITESSLSEDLQRFDFNHSSLGSTLSPTGMILSTDTKQAVSQGYVILESDELNNHDCMAPLVGLIQYMTESGIHKSPQEEVSEMPLWMKKLQEILATPSIHRNVVLFVLRLVQNTEPVFRPYAKFWAKDILNVLLNKVGGEPLNAFFRDVLAMILEWSADEHFQMEGQEELDIAEILIEKIIRNAKHERKDVTQSNIDMLKTIYTVWSKLGLRLPEKLIEEKLKSSDVLIGLQVLGVAITYQLPGDLHKISEEIVNILSREPSRSVARICAEVCGILLGRGRLDPKQKDKLASQIFAICKRWYSSGKKDLFVEVLHSLGSHHRPATENLAKLNWSSYNAVYGVLKTKCLEILSWSWRGLNDPWRDVGLETMKEILAARNPANTLAVLSLLKDLIRSSELFQWKSLWKELKELMRHEDLNCRSQAYELYCIAYDLTNGKDPEVVESVVGACFDPDENLRLKMLDFVASRLPKPTGERTIELLQQFYFPVYEKEFLVFSSYLILQSAASSIDYRAPIFDRPLADIPFEVMDLKSQSRFAQTLNFSQARSAAATTGTFQTGLIRGTAGSSLSFAPTQGASASLDWLMNETTDTTSPMDTSDNLKQGPSFGSELLSSLSTSAVGSSQSAVGGPALSWQRRFAKSSGRPSTYRKPAQTYPGSAKGMKEVPLYRRYRKGDLPDVQIPTSSLVAPLQAAAQKDPTVARLLFTGLVSSVRQQLREIHGSDADFFDSLSSSIRRILSESQQNNAAFMSSLMQILWEQSGDYVVNGGINVLAEVSQKIGLHQLAILVLENSLESSESSGRKSKAAKRSSTLDAHNANLGWMKVARLYSDLEDSDSARAVLAQITDVSDWTRKALHCEAQNQWERAAEFYSKALLEDLSPAEEELCLNFQEKCLVELSRWEELSTHSTNSKWTLHSRVCKALEKTNFRPAELLRTFPDEIPPSLLVYPDLALLNVLDNNLDQARDWIQRSLRLFSQKYSNTTDLSFSIKRKILEEVVPVAEVDNFLKNEPEALVRKWRKNLSGKDENLVIWDAVYRYRNALSGILNLDVEEYLGMLRLEVARSALQQNRVHLALKLTEGYPHSDLQIPVLVQAKAKILRNIFLEDFDGQINTVMEAKETADHVLKNSIPPDLRYNFEEFQAFLCSYLIPTMEKLSSPAQALPATKIQAIKKLWNLRDKNCEEILAKQGLDHLKTGVETLEASGLPSAANAYVHLANFCNKWRQFIGTGFSEELTNAVLVSMKLGSSTGSGLFPLALKESVKNPKAAEVFQQLIKSVPFSAYKKWTNQIISHLTQLPLVIGPLLVDLSKDFSQFLQIPFNITAASFSHKEMALPFVEQLGTILAQDQIWHQLISSIEYLLQPQIAAADFIKSALDNPKSAFAEYEKFRSKHLDLQKPKTNSLYGNVHYEFGKKFKNAFDLVFKSATSVSQDKLRDLRGKIDGQWKLDCGKAVLRNYSPWLASFKSRDHPNLKFSLDKDCTVTVHAVKEDFLILASLRTPVRISFIGNDAKEYAVLVKHNEDLRQDERIQGLFHIMNGEFLRNPECKDRNMNVKTYQVIPLNPKVGLVQWLANTVTLKSFVTSNKQAKASMDNASNHMRKHLSGDFYVKASREQVVAAYESCCRLTSPLVLRNGLKEISQSPEAFFFVRKQLAVSHAVLCIANWILGIGDRHLSNFLISTQTGEMIGIDFGMAFGLATYLLPIPELVPCRLTPQFQHLINGLHLNGPIRETMVLALKTLRNNPAALEAAMSIFVTEPTIDWIENSQRMAKKQSGSSARSPTAGFIPWSPDEALKRAESKLRGIHPAEATCLDLRSHINYANNASYISSVSEMIRGYVAGDHGKTKRSRETRPRRADFPAAGLSVEEQVDCLIDQATDPALLGRMFSGWEPWI